MGLLARRADDANVLGLSSRASMPRDVRHERDREVARSIARTQVMEADIKGIEHATYVGMHAATNITTVNETLAASIPYERGRVDAMADMGALAIQNKLRELGGL